MGFRFRRSINLGGGFRINISKSGIGYSWGGKGFRFTRTAKGGKHATVSFGHGLSYSANLGGARKSKKKNQTSNATTVNRVPQYNPQIDNNTYGTVNLVNNVTSSAMSEGLEHLVAAIRWSLILDTLANWMIGLSILPICYVLLTTAAGTAVWWKTLLLVLFAVLSIALKILLRLKGTVELDYDISPDMTNEVNNVINPILKILNSRMVWRVNNSSKVIRTKYTSGASNVVQRTSCKATQSVFPIKTTAPCAVFKDSGNNSSKETIVILPDKIFVIHGLKIMALDYRDVNISIGQTGFVEDEVVPSDTVIVKQTWKYVNKSGGPDTRFKDNRQYPVCLYGEISFFSPNGLNTVLMYSNPY
jgi:hypothetical protein